jgi:AcrR family transcriptional regulator
MVSRARKRLTGEERRAKILSAAVLAFASDGYERTSMDHIAALSKVTKPVLYDHFPSKQALFLTVLESIRDGLIADGKAIAEAGGGPEQKFRLAVDAFFQFVEAQPEAARVLLMVPRGDTAAANISRQVQAGAAAGIAALLTAVMSGSPSWRRQAAAAFLKEGLHAVAEWWLEHRGPSREEIVDVVIGLVWNGQPTNGLERV